MIDNDTMLVQLTVGQLRDIIDDRVRRAIAAPAPSTASDEYGELVWGNRALAEFLGVTPSTASVIATSGKYEGAILHPNGSRRVAFFPKLLKKLIKENSY